MASFPGVIFDHEPPSIHLLFFLVLGLFRTADGAQVQYASVMQEYSSSVGNKQFGPLQVLGKPDAMPQGGKSPCAWMSRLANSGKEYLEVSFDSLQVVRQVAVFENLNPGGVVAVSLIDEQGKTNRIYKGPAAATSEKSRVFASLIQMTPGNISVSASTSIFQNSEDRSRLMRSRSPTRRNRSKPRSMS